MVNGFLNDKNIRKFNKITKLDYNIEKDDPLLIVEHQKRCKKFKDVYVEIFINSDTALIVKEMSKLLKIKTPIKVVPGNSSSYERRIIGKNFPL